MLLALASLLRNVTKSLGPGRILWVEDVGGWIRVKWMLREIGWSGMDWIELTQDRDQWRVPVNTIMNLRFPKMLGSS
jgi:hypothetical protein